MHCRRLGSRTPREESPDRRATRGSPRPGALRCACTRRPRPATRRSHWPPSSLPVGPPASAYALMPPGEVVAPRARGPPVLIVTDGGPSDGRPDAFVQRAASRLQPACDVLESPTRFGCDVLESENRIGHVIRAAPHLLSPIGLGLPRHGGEVGGRRSGHGPRSQRRPPPRRARTRRQWVSIS